jgi:hypothetical protein
LAQAQVPKHPQGRFISEFGQQHKILRVVGQQLEDLFSIVITNLHLSLILVCLLGKAANDLSAE